MSIHICVDCPFKTELTGYMFPRFYCGHPEVDTNKGMATCLKIDCDSVTACSYKPIPSERDRGWKIRGC